MTRAGWVVTACCCLLSSGLGGCAVAPSSATASTTEVTVWAPAETTPATPVPSFSSAAAPIPTTTADGSSAPSPSTSDRVDLTGPIIDVPSASPFTVFSSPSGNIVCGGGKGDIGWNLRCDVNQHSWRLPPKPADCEFDWGHGAYLAKGRAGLTCVSDTVAGSDLVGMEGTWWNGRPGSQVVTTERGTVVALAYGASMRFGPITCLSQSDGLHCTDTTTGAGFDISREAYRLR